MNFNWKHKAGALALSAALLSVTATGPVEAKGKSGVIKPRDDVAPPSAEKGIRDPAVKGCGSCGITGRVAAPPAAGDPAPPPPAVDVETGQLLDKGPRWPNKPLKTSATPPPVDDAAAPGSAEKVGRPKVRDDGARDTSATRKKKSRPKERDDPVSTRSSLLPVLGGVAALAALVAAVGGGGNDNPTSP